jgi:hypothetical protein
VDYDLILDRVEWEPVDDPLDADRPALGGDDDVDEAPDRLDDDE